ncbi:MAG: hypothetical protein GY828_06220, partial [Candidatus Gracilibacteria bacterium]|nr:hypothetical protein [Candidatus Gracilibacteria bacterium]
LEKEVKKLDNENDNILLRTEITQQVIQANEEIRKNKLQEVEDNNIQIATLKNNLIEKEENLIKKIKMREGYDELSRTMPSLVPDNDESLDNSLSMNNNE